MKDNKLLNNIRERIALDNFNVENLKNKRNKKLVLIGASAATVILAGVLTMKTMKKRNRAEEI